MCTIKTDIDECQKQPCGTNAKCINNEGSFACQCEPGFVLRGKDCEGKINFLNNILVVYVKINHRIMDKIGQRERERDSTLLYLQCVKTELWGVYKAQERTKVKTSRIDRHENCNFQRALVQQQQPNLLLFI